MQTENSQTQQQPIVKPSFMRRVGRWLKNMFFIIGVLACVWYLILMVSLYFLLKSASSGDPSSIGRTAKQPSKDYVLVLDPRANLTSKYPDLRSELYSSFFGGKKSLHLYKLKNMVNEAIAEEKVKGIFIDMSFLSGRLVEHVYLRNFLEKFKETKKPIWVYSPSFSSASYFSASIADKLAIPPTGGVFFDQPMFQMLYMKEAADKLGIGFEVFRAGKYKSAFESFIKSDPSPETLEEMESLEESTRLFLVDKIGEGRNKDLGTVQSWIKRSLYSSKDALSAKLVDEIAHSEPFLESFKKSLGVVETFRFSNFLRATVSQSKNKSKEGVALIEATGSIHMDADDSEVDTITVPRMQKRIRWALEEKNVKAVVLRIDSPGGSALASEIIWQDIQKLAKKKPLIVSMGSVAASGGYYIAAPAQKIFVEPTTITGSIGVIGMIPYGKDLREKYGLQFHMVTKSDRKDLFHPQLPPSELDKEIMGKSIDEVYAQFLMRVAAGRKKSTVQIHEIAQGRVWTGLQAIQNGLADEKGDLFDAIRAAKKVGGLDPDKKYLLHRYKSDQLSLSDCLSIVNISKCMDMMGGARSMARVQSGPFSNLKIAWEKSKMFLPKGQAQSTNPNPHEFAWTVWAGGL